MYPDLLPEDLRPFHCERWADSRQNISQSTRRNYLRSIRRVVNWAIQQGYIEKAPLKGMQIPAYERREVCLSREEFNAMLGFVDKDWFRRLCVVAFETGCRPQELLMVEARHFDSLNSRWVFPVNESKGKRQPRVIYLTPKAEEITRELVAQYSEGPLFRNHAGKPVVKQTVASAFRRIRVLLGKRIMQERGIERDDAAIP